MSQEYFERHRVFEKQVRATFGVMCSLCPSREDSHSMNCIECCPLRRVAKEGWGRHEELRNRAIKSIERGITL